LCRELGLDQGKCIPHSLSLLMKKSCGTITLFRELIVLASGIIYAGGTETRAAALKELGLDPKEMIVYMNRFNSAVNVVKYRRANFAKVKQFHTTSATLPLGDGEIAALEADLAEDPFDSLKAKKAERGHAAARACAAYKDRRAPIVLYIVEALYGGIPDLVTATSGNGDRVPHNIVALLEAERRSLVMAQHDGGLVVVPAIKACYPPDERNRPTATAAEVREWTALFKPEVEHAAELSIAAFDNHIAPQLVFLKYRLFYSPRCRPPKRYTAEDLTAAFTGTDAAEYTHKFVAQALEYAEEVWKLWNEGDVDVGANKEISTPDHWTRLRATGLCNELCDVGEFWTSFETSSIPAERVFAVLRLMEVPTRGSQLPATWARELRFRVMRKTLDRLVVAAVDAVESC
jgi:hypothetical protein